MHSDPDLVPKLVRSVKLLTTLLVVAIGLIFTILLILFFEKPESNPKDQVAKHVREINKVKTSKMVLWTGPAEQDILKASPEQQKLIHYGKELIVHTADFLGPKGSVRQMSNGMNCQNCHLNAGSKPWGNNYFAVEATYPKFRARSGQIENQTKRINDCFERSLNGRGLDTSSIEMKAILAYLKWIGTGVPAKQIPEGSGIFKLNGLKRAADPILGKTIYEQKCQSCHQPNGEGILAASGNNYTFPPLWGKHSYNTGAGLYRISSFAGYVKFNMPFGANYDAQQLSDEEAWDVAAFVNSMPRPEKDLSKDWPTISGKPFDHPFGPYADPFSEKQHKFGPFDEIKNWKKQHQNPVTGQKPNS